MLTEADNVLLTRTGPGAPVGDLFRRFWQPVALSSELPEADGAPIRLTVLNEDLRAFRTTDGTVGLTSPRAVRIAAPTCSLAATSKVVSAAPTTAGNSPLTEAVWRCRRWIPGRPATRRNRTSGCTPIRPVKLTVSSGPIWVRRMTCRRFRNWNFDAAGRPSSSSPRSCSSATGRRRARAGWTPRISPSCTCRFPTPTTSPRGC